MPTHAPANASITRPLSTNMRFRSAFIISNGIAAATTYLPTNSVTGEEKGVMCKLDNTRPSTRIHKTPGTAFPTRETSAMKPTQVRANKIAISVSTSSDWMYDILRRVSGGRVSGELHYGQSLQMGLI